MRFAVYDPATRLLAAEVILALMVIWPPAESVPPVAEKPSQDDVLTSDQFSADEVVFVSVKLPEDMVNGPPPGPEPEPVSGEMTRP